MFVYEKKLQYPVNIKQTNPKLAKIIITQYGGPDGKFSFQIVQKPHNQAIFGILILITNYIYKKILQDTFTNIAIFKVFETDNK